MPRLIILSIIQALFLAGSQVLLKMGIAPLPKFSWTWNYWRQLITDWWLLACGASFTIATVLWLYILKHYPFHQAYPLTAIGFIFGMIAAIFIFGEQVSLVRWIGAILIVIGSVLIIR